jgi:5-formyltetrahydrofolate cyclo-ligase
VSTESDKAALRVRLREARRTLSAEQRALAAAGLAHQVGTSRLFRTSRRVAAYFSADGEIDPAPILARARAMGKRCYLPVLSRLSWDRLWFAPAASGTQLRPNRFGILEPVVTARELVRAPELDLILLPLVGFDAAGNRLGMGGGFYDKSLAYLGTRTHWRKPHLVGLAYECQRVARLPAAAWDIPLTAIATEAAIYFTAQP